MFIFITPFLLLLSLVTFSFILPVTTCAQLPLHPREAAVLRVIAEKLGAKLLNSTDPCQFWMLPLAIQHSGDGQKNTIFCNRTIGSFSHITNIKLKVLSLQGSLPRELVNLTYLQEIDLSRNYLSGTLPKEWASMRHLTNISLTANNLSGEIPIDWGYFANLTFLNIEANQLSGPVPKEFGNLVNLTNLELSSNFFSGSLPITLAKLKHMTKFRISDNSFTGTVPEFIGGWANLEMLEMYSSGLEGPIPAAVFSLRSLYDLRITDMDGPKFSFPNLTNKQYQKLILRNLNMSGSVHTDILEVTTTLDLTFNKLEGEINGIGTSPKYMFLSGNMFSGNIPEKFLDTSKSLDLSFNNFTPQSCPESRNLNMFRSFYSKNNTSGNLSCPRISSCQKSTSRTLHILSIVSSFNIKEIANGTGKEIIRSFNTTVTDNILEIRLYWAGKGTTCIPVRGNYGPLISAISICPGFKFNCDEPKSNLPIVVGVVTSVLFLILCVVGVLCWRRYREHKNTRERDLKGLDLQIGTFTYRQLKAATNNFDSANKIGEGGFGSVYKGQLSDGTVIAVKQLSSKSRQGNREFVNEIGMISGLQHPNLVKLFGCCVEGNQLLLVYEYMENNCLAHALFGSSGGTLRLDWATRQKICVGIARGLAFLHEGSTLRIVHRDIKTTNVLLDQELNAKISDFGLAKLKDDENTHISTRVAGTIGYMAPEYALWGYLTEKADVYSFGVVALEIVSGRSNASYRAENGCFCLLDWAFDLQQKGNLMEVVDENLANEFNKKEAERMIKVALLSCNATPSLRPTMTEVVSMLEEQTDIQDVISDPSIYNGDLQLKPFEDQSSIGSSTQKISSDQTSILSSTTSAHDLYSINSESIRGLTSPHDLYPLSSNTMIRL